MLNWLRNAAQRGQQQVAAANEKIGRRTRHARAAKAASSANATPNLAAVGAAAQGGANAGQQPNRPNDIQKYIRYAFLFIGGSIFINNVFLDPNNPDSLVNRALYPKGRGKYALKIERWDEKVANYRTAYNASTDGVSGAMRKRERHRKLQRLGSQLEKLSKEQSDALMVAAKRFSKAMESNASVLQDLRGVQTQIIQNAVQKGLTSPPDALTPAETATVISDETKDEKEKSAVAPTELGHITLQIGDQILRIPRFSQTKGGKQFREMLHQTLDIRMQIEMEFMAVIEAILQMRPETKDILKSNPDVVSKIKNSLLDLDSTDYDIIMEKLSQLSILPSTKPPKVFVLTFKGDVMASQVSRLREEITAILNVCDKERGDRVVLQLNSGGGTVTGYGLASAQLQRLRDVGLPLVVCIDEVAASGGYMMASVADYIIASPFAVVGSVGVIATVPNFSERLQREGVVVEDITAGKYKRTLTPYKKPNEEDRSKMKSDIEHVLVLFKSFLKSNRPMLNVDAIATGETWQGPDALKRGLVDELRTTDSYLSDLYNSGHDVLTVAIKPVAPRFSDVMEDDQHTQGSLFTWAQSWLAQVFQGAIEMALRSSTNGLNLDLNRKHDASTPVWRLEDGDDVDDMMAMTNRNAGTARTFRERIMMVYDQNKNPPML